MYQRIWTLARFNLVTITFKAFINGTFSLGKFWRFLTDDNRTCICLPRDTEIWTEMLKIDPDTSEALSFNRIGVSYLTMSLEGPPEFKSTINPTADDLEELEPSNLFPQVSLPPFYALKSTFSMKNVMAHASRMSAPHNSKPGRRKEFTQAQRLLASQAKLAMSIQDLQNQVKTLLLSIELRD
jgi:hypothetical protein